MLQEAWAWLSGSADFLRRVWVLVRRRGSVGQCSFLVGLKEMTLLSGFDQCGPCSYVANVNGKSQGEAGKIASQSLVAGDRAGGTLETGFSRFKLGVILAPVQKRFSCKG